jgi:hypothetical protein
MASWLKQSTAVDIALGPFLDETDGKTAETALTLSQADVRLKKNNGNWAQKNNASACSHEENGWYECPLSTADTDTLGLLLVAVHEAGALPVWREFLVVPANVWDAYLGADRLEVDVTQIGGDDQSATDLKDFADAGYDPATNKVEGLKMADALTANNDKTGYRLSAAGVDDIWDEAIAGHLSAGSTGAKLNGAGSLAGPGALTRTIRCRDQAANPIEGASVWVATDQAGTNVIAGPLTTNSQGVVTILVDAGSYYVWAQKDGQVSVVAQAMGIN